MGDTWITDLRHFLDEDGTVGDLPRPAELLVNYFGVIVEAVTANETDEICMTSIRCRRRPGRRPCDGEIIAFIDEPSNFAINWHCPECNDKGLISGWMDTIWDLR